MRKNETSYLLRLTKTEKAAYEEAARRAEMPLSAWIRSALAEVLHEDSREMEDLYVRALGSHGP